MKKSGQAVIYLVRAYKNWSEFFTSHPSFFVCIVFN